MSTFQRILVLGCSISFPSVSGENLISVSAGNFFFAGRKSLFLAELSSDVRFGADEKEGEAC